MHAGRRFNVKELFLWSWHDTKWLIFIAIVPTFIYIFITKSIAIPWQPVALLGTALSFIVGFKNNASYARLWEARQIYGAFFIASSAYSAAPTIPAWFRKLAATTGALVVISGAYSFSSLLTPPPSTIKSGQSRLSMVMR